jgi:hypothetical protein
LLCTGDIVEGRAHYDQAIALYDPGAHRLLATRFGVDAAVSVLSWRPLALWLLGHPEAALADANHAIKDAREIGNAATLMFARLPTQYLPLLTAETTRQQAHRPMNLSHWQTRKVPRSGKRME